MIGDKRRNGVRKERKKGRGKKRQDRSECGESGKEQKIKKET